MMRTRGRLDEEGASGSVDMAVLSLPHFRRRAQVLRAIEQASTVTVRRLTGHRDRSQKCRHKYEGQTVVERKRPWSLQRRGDKDGEQHRSPYRRVPAGR